MIHSIHIFVRDKFERKIFIIKKDLSKGIIDKRKFTYVRIVWKKKNTRNKDNYCYIIKKNFLVEKLKWNQEDRLKEHDDYDIYKAKTTEKNRIINHTFT